MKLRNVLIVGVLLLFLCGIASAGNANSYGKSKSGVLFQNDIDTSKITVEKGNKEIKISSNEHSETTVKLKKADIEALTGFTGALKIVHLTDEGINDWSKVVYPEDNNGYFDIDVEFSTVTIAPYISQVTNWNFEDWTGLTPDDWSTPDAHGWKSTDSAIDDYAYAITGDGVTAAPGMITQATAITPGYYKIGAYVKVTGRSSGRLNIDIQGGGFDGIGLLYADNTNGEYVWVETTEYISVSNPSIRIFTDCTPNLYSEWKVDGLLLSPVSTSSAAETAPTDYTYQQIITYSCPAVYTNSVYQTQFMYYGEEMQTRGKLTSHVIIDGNVKDSWVIEDRVYVDTSGLAVGARYIVITVTVAQPPEMISPSNGSTITRDFPPLYADQVFVWENTGQTCQMQVAEDSAFSNVVYSHETTSGTTTASLAEGTYYWRVRSYDSYLGTYGDYPDEYNFVIVTTTGSISGTGIAGCVYESQGLGDYQVVSGALATVYNDTYSVTKTTGSEGYYQVLGLSNGTYYVSVKKTGYDTSDITPVNVTANEVTIQNIAIQAAQSYFAPTDCTVKVKEHWYSFSGAPGITYAYYQNGDTATLGAGTTDSTGRFTMSDIEIGVRYRVVLTTDAGVQTEYIMPSSSELSFIIVLDLTEASLLPDSQFYDVVNVSVGKLVLNSTAASVTISWNGTDSNMTEVYYQIGQTANNGTFVVLDDYTETPTGTSGSHSFVVNDYLGQSYKVIVEFTEDSFGEVEKTYTVTFAGSTVPFIGGKALSYFGVFLVFIVAMMFGKAEHASGGLMVCGFSWFLWYLDVFTGFGSATNTTMAAGLIIGTVFALLAVVNEARKGANI
ncbi:MAG: carboxypeptidase-like regulatory domain-containing protein [Clostridia bacterium]|jgi:hypothetical protein|nr:carboxypeptidase-like regulatory domain-containing protein [Clostridia bacterium]